MEKCIVLSPEISRSDAAQALRNARSEGMSIRASRYSEYTAYHLGDETGPAIFTSLRHAHYPFLSLVWHERTKGDT